MLLCTLSIFLLLLCLQVEWQLCLEPWLCTKLHVEEIHILELNVTFICNNDALQLQQFIVIKNLFQNLCLTNCHPNKKKRSILLMQLAQQIIKKLLLFQEEKLYNIIQHFPLLHLHVRNISDIDFIRALKYSFCQIHGSTP